MTSSELAALAVTYLDDPTVRPYPGDAQREFRENTWCYSSARTHRDERSELIAALRTVAAELRKRTAGHHEPVTYYVWYDAQAQQLRMSMHSCSPDNLPFRGEHYATDDPGVVIDQLLLDADRDGIPLAELTTVTGHHRHDEEPMFLLPVWAVQLA